MAASVEPEGQFEDIGSKTRIEMCHFNDLATPESKPLLNTIQPEIQFDNTNGNVACFSTKRPKQNIKTTTPHATPTTENTVHLSCAHGHHSICKIYVSCLQTEEICIKTSSTIVLVEETNEMKGPDEKNEAVVDVHPQDIDKLERYKVNSSDTATDSCNPSIKKCGLSAALLVIMFTLWILLIISVVLYHYIYIAPLFETKGGIIGNNNNCSEKMTSHIKGVEFKPKSNSMVDSVNRITWIQPEPANSFSQLNDTGQFVRLDDTGQQVIAQETGMYSIFVSMTVDLPKCDHRHNVTSSMICIRNSKYEKEKCAKVNLAADSIITLNVNDHIFLETNDLFFVSGSDFRCGDPVWTYMTVIKY